jgi:hypothetical protein
MARSYRKPILTSGYGSYRRRWYKNQANRMVRRTPDVPDGKAYRKVYDPWDVIEYKNYLTPDDDWFGGHYISIGWIDKRYTGSYTKAKRK